MADDPIVVVGKPETTIVNNPPAPAPGPGFSDPMSVATRQNAAFNANLVKQDSDVADDEILVLAKSKFKETAGRLAIATTYVKNASFSVPCLSSMSGLRGILLTLRFNLQSKEFGPGKAGENLADGSTVTNINMNVKYFKDYLAYGEGGAGYLLTHELAHSFKEMRDFNAQKFQEYRDTGGKGLSLDAARQAFTLSPQGIQVEARANTIARAIYNKLSDGKDFGFTPTNNYAVC